MFSTWMPACWMPLKGVMIGEVAPGSQPRLNGTLGLLNHSPRWYWCVGAKVVVTLPDPTVIGNVHDQNGAIAVDFANAKVPEDLVRRMDVTDFATP